MIEGVAAHRGDQRAHDRRPRAVARDMDDAAAAVRGLQAEREAAPGVAVEGDAVALELGDGGRRRRGDAGGDGGIAEAVAGGQRVGGVQRRIVVLAHGGGDAALRPGRGGALGKRRLGEQDHGLRRQPQRRHQPGQAAADDDGAPARSERIVSIASSLADRQHALDGAAGAVGDGGIDRHLVLHGLERAADLGQGDALHVRAEIAGPHEVDVRD